MRMMNPIDGNPIEISKQKEDINYIDTSDLDDNGSPIEISKQKEDINNIDTSDPDDNGSPIEISKQKDDINYIDTYDLDDNDDIIERLEGKEDIDLIVDFEYDKVRIDRYLTSIFDDMSRSYIQKLIGDGLVLADGKPVKSNYRVVTGEAIALHLPEPKEAQTAPEDIYIDIIYEDNDIIVINKHKGLVIHPAPGHESGTLVNALLYHCRDNLSGINGVLRPGIVHRIDRDTTGVIVACKNDIAHRFIAEQLKEHTITRRYQAIVYNIFKTDSGRVESTIGRHPKDRKKMAADVRNGKYAATNYRLIENLGDKYAYIECELETGRTHQIRVHMASINHPILGDTVYGPNKNPFHLEGQALHAGVLGLIHPRTKEYIEFTAPLPDYFTDLLTRLRGQ